MKKPALQVLWEDHEAARFPPGCRGIEVDGADLVLCDSYAAGCISTYLEEDALYAEKRNALIRCIDVLHAYLPSARGEPKQYFERLLQMSEGVLEEIPQDAK